ncbi:hypothetical protein DL93DRAFT_2054584, partial [Clavulina sp. PMI_390]
KITAYRILTTVVILGFGLAKASLSYMGWTVAPITLEWIMGVVAAIVIYWLGPCEALRPKIMPWIFHRDLIRSIRDWFVKFSRTRNT